MTKTELLLLIQNITSMLTFILEIKEKKRCALVLLTYLQIYYVITKLTILMDIIYTNNNITGPKVNTLNIFCSTFSILKFNWCMCMFVCNLYVYIYIINF